MSFDQLQQYHSIPGTGAEDVDLADPEGWTKQAAGNIFGQPAQNLMNQGMQGFSAWNAPSSDPNSFMNQYLNDFGGLTGAITEATSPLSQQLQGQVDRMTQRAVENVGSQMSGLGGLRSSGMANIAGEAAGEIAANAGTQLAQAQLGMLGQQAGQAMQGRQAALSQMMGLPMQMMSLQGQFAAPEYVSPQVAASKSGYDYMMDAFGMSGDITGAVGSLIPF